MNRRTFIETSIAATMVASRPAWAAEAHQIDRVGLQLYTVRDLMKKDFEGTIARVAQVGYKEVEFAGYFDKSPQDVRKILDANKLTSPSEHVPYDTVAKKWPETLEAAQKAGIQFAYHNHAFEFEPSEALGGKLPYDFLLAETDAKLVKMEMDLCWITVGGHDPLEYFNRYPDRFPLVHVKDWSTKGPGGNDYGGATGAASKPGHIADPGQGEVDFKRVFAESGKAGIQHYFVENDEPKSPFDDLKISYDYLATLKF